jgi:hypothetical protein
VGLGEVGGGLLEDGEEVVHAGDVEGFGEGDLEGLFFGATGGYCLGWLFGLWGVILG